jgi:hypothetical protein
MSPISLGLAVTFWSVFRPWESSAKPLSPRSSGCAGLHVEAGPVPGAGGVGCNRPAAMVSEIVATSRRAREGSSRMATYRMVYGDDEQVVRETFADIDEVEREDGWGGAVPRPRGDLASAARTCAADGAPRRVMSAGRRAGQLSL